MFKSEIKAALDAFKKIKMPKIDDKEFRNLLIENHFVLLEAGRKAETKLDDARKVAFSAFEDEQAKIEDLQREFQGATDDERRAINREIASFTNYWKATREYAKLVDDVNHEEVTGLKKVDRTKFMEAIEKQDYSLEWVEALYPLFVIENKTESKDKKTNK